jgi:tyrosyl-tRNA synthetase
VQVLKDAGLVATNGEGRRLISQGGVRIDGEPIDDPNFMVKKGQTYTVKAGKRRFLHIT